MIRAPDEIVKLLHKCERVARLSDRIVKVGPLNLGIDSALALLPVGGGLYTIGLGAWLLYMGHKAQASTDAGAHGRLRRRRRPDRRSARARVRCRHALPGAHPRCARAASRP